MRNRAYAAVEQHYHIKELIDAQEKRAEDREQHRAKAKNKEERMEEIKDSKGKDIKPFWCSACKEDFIAESIKEVEKDWTCMTQYIAFYRTKHWCGKWCIRLVTDTYKDAYWFKSRMVKADQGKHYAETIQPHQTGFNILYKKI